MSVESWKAEFYPVTAHMCEEKDALAHSLKKWEGLRKENLGKHGIVPTIGNGCLLDTTSPSLLFRIDSSTCALCQYYDKEDYFEGSCSLCPLSKALGGFRCDFRSKSAGGAVMPYAVWTHTGNPEPMIEALVKAQQLGVSNGEPAKK